MGSGMGFVALGLIVGADDHHRGCKTPRTSCVLNGGNDTMRSWVVCVCSKGATTFQPGCGQEKYGIGFFFCIMSMCLGCKRRYRVLQHCLMNGYLL